MWKESRCLGLIVDLFWPDLADVIFCPCPIYKKKKKLAKDLLHPSPEEEKRRHKKKRLVQSPNSYFMDVKCPGMDFLQLTLGTHGSVPFPFVHLDWKTDVSVITSFLSVFQVATRSQQCSATLRQLCCVLVVQRSCVSPLEAKHVSQRVSISIPNLFYCIIE